MKNIENPDENTNSNCPIAVYQMGKVGSETIIKSLNQLNLPNSIYHVHVMYSKNLENSFNHLKEKNLPLTLQLKQSKELRKHLDSQERPHLKIITVVREPISQQISAFFQNLERLYSHLLDPDGNCREDKIKGHLKKIILGGNLQALQWFDRELKYALDLDVYEYEFNQVTGYQILKKNNINVLILRLESSDVWSQAIVKFLKLPNDLNILSSNIGSNKKSGKVYKKLIQEIKFTKSDIQKIYSSKYCKHFYPPYMIEQFINKWCI